jgi:hypothetical protein
MINSKRDKTYFDSIEGIIEAQMELLFDSVADHYELENEDTPPSRNIQLMTITHQLKDYLSEYVEYNN